MMRNASRPVTSDVLATSEVRAGTGNAATATTGNDYGYGNRQPAVCARTSIEYDLTLHLFFQLPAFYLLSPFCYQKCNYPNHSLILSLLYASFSVTENSDQFSVGLLLEGGDICAFAPSNVLSSRNSKEQGNSILGLHLLFKYACSLVYRY